MFQYPLLDRSVIRKAPRPEVPSRSNVSVSTTGSFGNPGQLWRRSRRRSRVSVSTTGSFGNPDRRRGGSRGAQGLFQYPLLDRSVIRFNASSAVPAQFSFQYPLLDRSVIRPVSRSGAGSGSSFQYPLLDRSVIRGGYRTNQRHR